MKGSVANLRIKTAFSVWFMLLCVFLCSCGAPAQKNAASLPPQTLNILHVPDDIFTKSIINARNYVQSENVICGVVPHHLVAADLIAGFFKALKNAKYDTVIIIAPDHSGGYGQAIISRLGWSVGSGVMECDTELLSQITAIKGIDFVTDDIRLLNDHSASNLIPYIRHYLPKAKIVPILLSNRIDCAAAERFAKQLYKLTAKKTCLVMFSIDFSHYLTPPEARQQDLITKQAILCCNLTGISHMGNSNLDCPPALEIYLAYTKEAGATPQILDNTDASKLINYSGGQTTSYFIIRTIKKR